MSSKLMMALCATAAIVGLTGARGAVAQQADQQTAANAGGGRGEIVVTARRKEERLQSVPLAITAFSQTDLEKQHIQEVRDLGRTVPSLAVSNSQSDSNAPYSSQTRRRGLLQIAPKKPTNNFEGYGQFTFGNYGDKEFEGAVNIPVVDDKLMVRIAGQRQERDGYTKDYYTGKDLDNRDYYSWRVSVTARPWDDFENDFIYDGYYQDSNGSSTILRYVNSKYKLADIPLGPLGSLPLTLGSGPAVSGPANPATLGATPA